jgi:hypothetical protein
LWRFASSKVPPFDDLIVLSRRKLKQLLRQHTIPNGMPFHVKPQKVCHSTFSVSLNKTAQEAKNEQRKQREAVSTFHL